MSNGYRGRYGDFICVLQKLIIYVTGIGPDVQMSKQKAANSCFRVLRNYICALDNNQTQ